MGRPTIAGLASNRRRHTLSRKSTTGSALASPSAAANSRPLMGTAGRNWNDRGVSRPTLIVSTIVEGPVLFVHDADKMRRGEPCTTVYLWLPDKGKDEEVASFHCVPTHRAATGRFIVRTRPNLELGYGCVLSEYQFAGDPEGHAVPSPPKMTD